MIEEIKNNPIMLIIGVIAIVNIILGDSTQTAAIIESAALVLGGLVARAKVTPMRKVELNAN
jgi:hypothetical protein